MDQDFSPIKMRPTFEVLKQGELTLDAKDMEKG
jgi:hypothetical protein